MKSLKNNPLLRILLINYVSIQYEQDALFDNYSLVIEYNNLLNNNELDKLFECEQLTERFKYWTENRVFKMVD